MKLMQTPWRVLLLGAALALAPLVASASNLAVNLVLQRTTDANSNAIGNNWCWAASSKMILDYYGYTQTLQDIVTYGVGDVTYDTWNYGSGAGSESRDNVGVWQAKVPATTPPTYELKMKTIDPLSWKANDRIIKNFSNDEVQTQYYRSDLSADQITKEIDDRSAPFIRRIGWDAGGGHFTVVYGVNGGVLSIRDPWFGSYVASDALARRGAIGGGNFTWTHTLTTSKILDVLFLFDTTGSMGPYIDDAKAKASTLLDTIATKFKNYRVAVANYKDHYEDNFYPDGSGGPGDPGDYVYDPTQPFTTDKATAQAGINAVPGADGGGDIPEALYSALFSGLNGDGLADADGKTWRDDPAKRIIIVISDAPGHNPEPWTDGHNFGEIRDLATTPALPISVHCLWAGTDINAGTQFSSIAGGTGGSVGDSPTGSDAGAGLTAIINSVAANPRFPKGSTGAIYPTFSFEPLGLGSGSMAADATGLMLEVQKLDPADHTYKRLRLITLKNTKVTVYQSTMPFAQGDYQWRLGFKRPAGNLFLPSVGEDTPPDNAAVTDPLKRDPKKTVTKTTAAKVTFESDFTQFTRIPSAPAHPTLAGPSASFTAFAKAITFSFTTVPGATSYVLEVLHTVQVHGSPVTKVFKKVTLKPPKNDPGAVTLSKKLSGFVLDSAYTWRVQGLNYDRPKVDDTAW